MRNAGAERQRLLSKQCAEARVTASAHGQPGVVAKDGNPAVCVCGVDFREPIDVQQIRTVNAHELTRIQHRFELRHRLFLQKSAPFRMDRDVIVLRFGVIDLAERDDVNGRAVADEHARERTTAAL